MKLASLNNGSRDGQLIVVSPSGNRYLCASGIAPHLQAALDEWKNLRPALERLAEQLTLPHQGTVLQVDQLCAPLPRAYEWIDGSAYLHHIRLSRRSRNASVPATLETEPMAYQGGSGVLLAARSEVVLPDAGWDLDMEGEVCVIVDDIPRGISPTQAEAKILLVLLANDLTYRGLVPGDLAKGFGFLHSKPATAFSPWAVTPDQLGSKWHGGRLHLPLHCTVNGQRIGQANAGTSMHFSFGELIAHAAKTRSLTAGTLIGSGTVSSPSPNAGASCLVEIRAQQIIDGGGATVAYLQCGDKLRIEALTEAGESPFGAIEQSVVAGTLATPLTTAPHSPSSPPWSPPMTDPVSSNPLGLTRLLGIHYYVRQLERSRRFYTECLRFAEIGKSNDQLEKVGRQKSLVFEAGQCTVVCSQPIGSGGRASRYLSRHPDGIGTLAFEVTDIEETFRYLDKHGGTPISRIKQDHKDGGWIKTFSITTPFGDTTFRFIQRHQYTDLFHGMERYETPQGAANQLGFTGVDHITSNFQTMSPALLWLEHVMGLKRFWGVQFHTDDSSTANDGQGSGLRSAVFWEPSSNIKFANNEPYRPSFRNSQINLFHEDHRGDGVQHIALVTTDILTAVRKLRASGAEFMPTPGSYYDMLPERMAREGVGSIEENIDELRELGILVDGDHKGAYLLQIFLKDSAGLYGAADAGPFFYEVIQRKGDDGFGAGNFRALFESIEREQTQASAGK